MKSSSSTRSAAATSAATADMAVVPADGLFQADRQVEAIDADGHCRHARRRIGPDLADTLDRPKTLRWANASTTTTTSTTVSNGATSAPSSQSATASPQSDDDIPRDPGDKQLCVFWDALDLLTATNDDCAACHRTLRSTWVPLGLVRFTSDTSLRPPS